MSTIRVISAVEALYAGGSPATGTGLPVNQINRVQSCSYSYTIPRVDANEFGKLAPMSREIVEAPTASLDFSYFLVNLLNEHNLGFVTDGSASTLSGIINATTDERNYYLTQSPYGTDNIGFGATGTSDGRVAYGIGNGALESYSTEAAVGGFPTSTLRVQGLNLVGYNAPTGNSPAIIPSNGARVVDSFNIPVATSGIGLSVLKHGDISMNIGASQIGVSITDAKIQRYTLSFNLRRQPQQAIGSRFPFARVIEFPVPVTLSVEANLGDIATGDLSLVFCNDLPYNLAITLNTPSCPGVTGIPAVNFQLLGAKLDSSNFASNIQGNKTVSLTYSANIGSPSDTSANLLFSGILN